MCEGIWEERGVCCIQGCITHGEANSHSRVFFLLSSYFKKVLVRWRKIKRNVYRNILHGKPVRNLEKNSRASRESCMLGKFSKVTNRELEIWGSSNMAPWKVVFEAWKLTPGQTSF